VTETGTAPLDIAAIDPGRTVLVAGPALTNKRRLLLEVLAGRAEGAAAVVTNRKTAGRIRREFGEFTDLGAWDFRVIDCVGRQRSAEREENVQYVSSAGDLTGIGMKLSGVMQEFYHDAGAGAAGIGLHSLSAMLMYADIRRVYQLVHVFTGRIASSGFVGAFAFDTVPGDTQALDRLTGLFDVLVEVREDPERALRVRGADVGPRSWTAF